MYLSLAGIYAIFDTRWCFLDEAFMDRPRGNVFCNVSNKDNIVFGVGRQGLAVGEIEWCLATVSHYAMDANIFRRGGVTASPLYIYDNGFLHGIERRPNLNMEIIRDLEKHLKSRFFPENAEGDGFTPIDIVDYVLAVLYSHKFREQYKDELKINYPQVPYPTDLKYFRIMVNLGKELRNIMTMDTPISTAKYSCSQGSNTIDRYKLQNNKIYINKSQYFYSTDDSISMDSLWEYTIGGNQPLQKWLKDRKAMTLDDQNTNHYLSIIAGVERIIEIMEEIDKVIILD